MSSDTVLQVENLTVSLRVGDHCYPVVRNISFGLEKGKTLALVGESGSGKSMTAHALLRLIRTPPLDRIEGKVLFQGVDLVHANERTLQGIRGGKISIVFQDPGDALNPVMTVGDQLIEAYLQHHKADTEEAFARVDEVLREVGIANPEIRMFDYPHQLSGGMKQRVTIAMALLGDPEILILDEPTTALDVTVQAGVIELIRKIQRTRGTSVLLITHDMGTVAELADDVIVMYLGTLVEQGPAEVVFSDPKHPYTIGLFSSIERVGKRGELKAIRGQVPPITAIPAGCPFHTRCDFAFERCMAGEVENFTLSKDPLHTARCWLYDKK